MRLIKIFMIAVLVLTSKAVSQEITQQYILDHYQGKAEKIINKILADSTGYNRLGYLCDVFGPRLSGSANLERSLDWLYSELKKDGFSNVRKDSVWVPYWKRGVERCEIVSPMNHNIPVLAFGGSISTKGEVTAPVLVVGTFDELEKRASEAKGKIVVYNAPFENYGQAVQYRFYGAIRAGQLGAVASLTRSVTPQNFNSLHTGMMAYSDSVPKIAHAAIAIEDAELLQRLQNRGIQAVLKLNLQSENLPDVLSWNLRGELKGRDKANEIIAAGGHIDSWDVGTGAHDDASGCLTTWSAIKALKDLNLVPRRTLRTVFWANEENGVRGGNAYKDQHSDETHVLMFEFDSGCFPPSQIRFSGNDTLMKIVKFIEPLLMKIDSVEVMSGGGGVDIGPMVRANNIPAMSLGTRSNGNYFRYHHSNNDTFDKIIFSDFTKCTAAIAVALYIYADLPINYLDYIIKK